MQAKQPKSAVRETTPFCSLHKHPKLHTALSNIKHYVLLNIKKDRRKLCHIEKHFTIFAAYNDVVRALRHIGGAKTLLKSVETQFYV